MLKDVFIPVTALLASLALGSSSKPGAETATCASLTALVGRNVDAAPAFEGCLGKVRQNGLLVLKPGVYVLRSPVKARQPVTIVTQGLGATASSCTSMADHRCATLLLANQHEGVADNTMPVEISAANVTLSHLIIRGSMGQDLVYDHRTCDDPKTRPLGGGIRVAGRNFTLIGSIVRDMACYTSLEIVNTAIAPKVHNNIFGPNGNHNAGARWADGVTIHDTSHAIVSDNLFIDNTDVQLIFGGCRSCRITGNRFRHSGAFSGASFAELMLHAWPSVTSGRYNDTVVSGNDVDCGANRRCGYGMMIGSSPWYKAPTSGGVITDNHVANAMVGINIDGITESMTIYNNSVVTSGGQFASDCGNKNWPAVNIAPSARQFVKGWPSATSSASINTVGCILNRTVR